MELAVRFLYRLHPVCQAMFRIQGTQIEAFNQDQVLQFRQRLHEHLQAFFPEDLPAGAAWESMFERGMQDARRFRLLREANITIYFNIMLSLGPAFASEYAWALPILNDRRMHENEKM